MLSYVGLIAALCASSALADESMKCPPGITNYADDSSDKHYWHCPSVWAMSVRRECEELYDRASGMCVKAESEEEGLVKRGSSGGYGELQEREALGEVLELGTLYNARNSKMYNGFSFWHKDALTEHKVSATQKYSSVDIFLDHGVNGRTYKLAIDASLKLEFMGGLISVSGSAHYLRDESYSRDTARVTMSLKSTTSVETIPVNTPLSFDKYCDDVKSNSGPTHVVTSITYGQRSYLLFEKEVTDVETIEEIGGSLSVVINSLPQFNMKGSAKFDSEGRTVKDDEKVRIKFYGDALISKMPGSYNDSVATLNDVLEQAKTSKTPIKFQLTPINRFCDGTNSLVNALNKQVIETTTDILGELAETKKTTTTLLGKDPSIRFASIKSRLLQFESGLNEFTNKLKADVANLLPKIKSGQVGEKELLKLQNRYYQSQYSKDTVNMYLDQRSREISTIQTVTKTALKWKEIKLSDIGAASDNQCIFKHKYATVYVLYVLPSTGNGAVTDSDAWYNDIVRVGKAGGILSDFFYYALNNAGDDHCMLIRLDSLAKNTGNDAEVHMYVNGRLTNRQFQPPVTPPRPTCAVTRYDGFVLATTATGNSDVTGHRVLATRKVGNDTFKYPFRLANGAKLEVKDLLPNTRYNLTTYYEVLNGVGKSADSAQVECRTAAMTAPVLPRVTAYSTTTLTVTWSKPQQYSVDNFQYIVTASAGDEAMSEVVTRATSTQLRGLEPNTYYTISIRAQYAGVRSEAVAVSYATTPYPPSVPLLEAKTSNSFQLVVELGEIRPPGAVLKDALLVQYYKMSTDVKRVLAGTTLSKTISLASNQKQDQIVKIDNLDAGVKYGVKAKLRLRVEDELIETDYSQAIVVNTPLDGSDFSAVGDKLKAFTSATTKSFQQARSKASGIRTKLNTFNSAVSTKDTQIGNKLGEANKQLAGGFKSRDNVVTGFSSGSCIEYGMMYNSRNPLQTRTNVANIYDCLKYCKARSGCYSVSYHISKKTCALLKTRRGDHFVTNHFQNSANLLCYEIGAADTQKWAGCTMSRTKSGGVLETTPTIASLQECVSVCTFRESCVTVTWNKKSGDCQLKNSAISNNDSANPSYQSLNLSCLR